MQICENCGTQNTDTAAFCDECGYDLAVSRDQILPSGQRARLTLPAHGKTFDMGNRTEIMIGREDERNGIFVDVDLSPFQDAMAAIHRRHARLVYGPHEWQIQDWGGHNDIWINSQRLQSFPQRVSLASGDRIRLGKLELVFGTY